jgi:hypothetical protein
MPLKLQIISVNLGLLLALSGCSNTNDTASTIKSSGANPVLAVEQRGYRFSMYPQYVDESKSLIKLDVRDKEDRFVDGAVATAKLRAADGHIQSVSFREDPALQRYVADVPLKHHEDYVIDTEVSFEEEKFRPEFVFHCGDPVPELVEFKQEGSDKK